MPADNKRLGARSFEKDAERLLILQQVTRLPPSTMSGLWYRIWVVHASGATAEDFPVSDAGMTAALAVAASGDDVYVPPAIFTGSYTIPAGVTVSGYGTIATIFTGLMTLGGDGSFLRNASITRTASQAGELIGIQGPDTGCAYLNTVSVIITNNGAGNAVGLDTGDGKLDTRESNFHGVANSGDGIGVRSGADDDVNFYSCTLRGDSSSGDGYGILTSTGAPYMDSGWLSGSTAPATGTPVEGLYLGGIVLSDGLMTRPPNEYNSDEISGRFTLADRLAGYIFNGSVGTAWDWLQIDGNAPNTMTGSGTIGKTGSYAFGVTLLDHGLTWEQVIAAIAPDATYQQFANTVTSDYIQGVEVGYTFRIFGFEGLGPPTEGGGGGVSGLRPIYYGMPDTADSTLRTNGVRMDVPPVTVPVWGDRSAWDVLNYADRHAYDINADIGLYHLPQGANSGDVLIWNGAAWVAQAGSVTTYEMLMDDDLAILLDDDSGILQEA